MTTIIASIVIDCDTCVMQGSAACGDCVVTHVCGSADGGHEVAAAAVFDRAEQRAVRWFAQAGLMPTLRHRGPPSTATNR